jgi:hypothetical protein
MDSGAGGSFRIHLQSLKDFAQLLAEQLEVVQRSAQAAAVLNRPPDLPLGAFAEAFSLSDEHSDEVAGVADLMGKVARSIDFARSVTTLVAQRYEALDSGGAQNIAAVAGGLPAAQLVGAAPAQPGFPLPTVYGLPVAAGHPAGYPPTAPAPATGTATPPPGSLAQPEVVAQFEVPVPPDGGTVYYVNGTTTAPVTVTVKAQDA